MTDRGRLTLPFLVFFLFAFGLFAVLFPVFQEALEGTAAQMSPGTLLMWQLFPAAAGAILLTVVYQKATAGV